MNNTTEKCFEEVGHDATKLFQTKLAISGFQSNQLQDLLTRTATKGWNSVRFGVYLLVAMSFITFLTMCILFISDNITYLRIYFQNVYNQRIAKNKKAPIPVPTGVRVRMYVYTLLGIFVVLFLYTAFQLYTNRYTIAGDICQDAKKALAIVS
jgi:hypothetical protein